MSDSYNGNCFILTRPEEAEDSTITVVKMGEFKSDRENKTLYKKSFEKFFLNLEDRLPEIMHKQCLATVLPTMALLIHHEMREAACSLRENFIEHAPEALKEDYENFPDQESSLHCVLEYNLNLFRLSVGNEGIQVAIKQHQQFFSVMQKVYFELPVIFISTLIDMATP